MAARAHSVRAAIPFLPPRASASEIGSPFIAVSLNYRLNVFGFLGSTDILNTQSQADIRGLNFGTYDQKVGLTWVARNIVHFGGDPEQITLGGHSSGSHSVHTHLLDADAHTEKPLFQRALMQSGAISIVSPQSLADAEGYWDKLCQIWGVQSNSSSQHKVETLRRISPAAILKSVVKNNIFMQPPIADDVTMTMETVALPHVDLRRQVKPMDYKPVEVMIGVAEIESAGLFQGIVDIKKLQEVFAKSYKTADMSAEVLSAYGLVEGAEQSALLDGIVQFQSDAVFDVAIHRTRVLLSKQRRKEYGEASSIPPYNIEFENPFPGAKRGCAHHGVEMIYQFDAFHDALADADKGIFHPYPQPTEGATAADSYTSAVRHLDLVDEFQDHWIGFIIGKPVQKVAEGEIFDWGRDGSTRVERLSETSKWVARLGRLRVLEKDIPSMLKVLPILGQALS